jgi:acetylornithine deacetylase/succinyl-diaminopimelate desuccinylase-like protein
MLTRFSRICAGMFVALVASGVARAAETPADEASNKLAHETLKELVEINTTDSVGSVTEAVEAMAQRFRAAGFPAADVVVAGPENPKRKNLVVRLHGTGKHRPVLLMGHLDVVEARREDWTTDPFKLVEKDGYLYGRGTSDMKDGDAIMVATLLRMKQEGYQPDRDIILALTADEEGGCCNGPDWLLKHKRELVDAEFAIDTDGWSVVSEHGVPKAFRLGATQKVYADYQLSVTNRGGHSSEPRADNAINQLARALLHIADYKFPFELNNITRAYYERVAESAQPERAKMIRGILQTPPDAEAVQQMSDLAPDNAIMRTNCVATRLAGGHANNALPQRAEAIVNCRILPGHSPEEVRQKLISLIADAGVAVHYIAFDGTVGEKAPERGGVLPPPLNPQVLKPLDAQVAALWPGLAVIPYMDAGASDAIYTSAAGIPTYGISGIAIDVDDVRAHGRDERVGLQSFYTGNAFFYRYMKALTSQ